MPDVVFSGIFRTAPVKILQHLMLESHRVYARLEDVVLMVYEAEKVPAAGVFKHLRLKMCG